MKIKPARGIFFTLVLLILLLPIYLDAGEIDYHIAGLVNKGNPTKADTFFIKIKNTLYLHLIPLNPETEHINEKSQLTIKWYRLKPVLKEYSNLWSNQNPTEGNIHIEPIEYQVKPLDSLTNKTTICVNEIIKEQGPGTYYFTFKILRNNDSSEKFYKKFNETEILHKKNFGRIVQVVVRSDDTYIGYLSELLKTPFIIAPMLSTKGLHQTDCRVGSDCAAFAIYGKRRQGFKIPYVGPRGISGYLNPITTGEYLPVRHKGIDRYMDRHGALVSIGNKGLMPGDIVHFAEQVSVFYKDQGVPGELDGEDLLFQCFRPSPHITTMAQSGFYHKPIKIFRWKQ